MADTALNSYAIENSDVAYFPSFTAALALKKSAVSKIATSYSGAATGKTFYIDSGGDVAKLTIGSTGQVLTVAGGLPTWATPKVVLVTSTTVSSPASSVVFTDIPSSGYSHFILINLNVVTAEVSTTSTMSIHVSTDNGSTWKTTSGDYYNGVTAKTLLGDIRVCGNSSTFKYQSSECHIYGLGNSARGTQMISIRQAAGVSATNLSIQATPEQNGRMVAEADNALRFTINGGSNISSGIFQLYGVTE